MRTLGTPPFTCLVTEGKATPRNYETQSPLIIETAAAAAQDGVTMIEIREKAIEGRLLFDLTRRVVDSLAGTHALVLVNDRADVAAAAGADGVHLPAMSLAPSVVRKNFPDLMIGVSTHSLERVRAAMASGADYVFFGPVFETPGKGEPTGIEELAKVCRVRADFPVIALGGIDATNCEEVVAVGAAGIAAIRALNNADSRRVICRRLKLSAA